jgi:hypothetical protein
MDPTMTLKEILALIPKEGPEYISQEMDSHRKGHWFESSIAHH